MERGRCMIGLFALQTFSVSCSPGGQTSKRSEVADGGINNSRKLELDVCSAGIVGDKANVLEGLTTTSTVRLAVGRGAPRASFPRMSRERYATRVLRRIDVLRVLACLLLVPCPDGEKEKKREVSLDPTSFDRRRFLQACWFFVACVDVPLDSGVATGGGQRN